MKPAIEARKKSPRNDAISFFLEDGCSNKTIIIECLTYGTAGMLTMRTSLPQFIYSVMSTILEGPMRVATMISAVQSALRARDREYQIREHLAEHERSEAKLLANGKCTG